MITCPECETIYLNDRVSKCSECGFDFEKEEENEELEKLR